VLLGVLMVACGAPRPDDHAGAAPEPADSPLVVFTVNYPLEYFAKRIAGDRAQVEFPAPPEVDPAFWSPDASIVSDYQRADLILRNGAGYAGWIDRVTLPASKLVDTSAGFRDDLIEVSDSVVHAHGPEGDHSHGQKAFTTWLDPTLAVEHARAIRDAMVMLKPEHELEFEERFQELRGDLEELDATLQRNLAAGAGLPVLASHPVYQYLERRYRLDLESVHFEPDEYPDEQSWNELEEILADHPARFMLWERQPTPETVRALLDLGIESVVFNPCSNAPVAGDFLTVMTGNARALERALSP
jgi:zinc transport system substrate-binding protein